MSDPPVGIPQFPLANPKKVEHNCELCNKPAYLQCSICRVTFYCGIEHQKVDWISVHERICNYLKIIREPKFFIVSESERNKNSVELREKLIDLVNLTKLIGKKFLYQGKFGESLSAALQCLKLTIDAYGLASIELVIPYLILAESSIYLKRLTEGETYLSQAQWIVVKNKHLCTNDIKSELYQILGILYMFKGEYDDALESLAKNIFYSSCEYGTDHIRTVGGYFYMGQVFYALHEKESLDLELNEKCKNANSINNSKPNAFSKIVSCEDLMNSLSAQQSLSLYENESQKISYPIQMPESKIYVADSLYYRIIEIWYTYLKHLIEEQFIELKPKDGLNLENENLKQSNHDLNEAEIAEAEKFLYSTQTYIEKRLENKDEAFVSIPGKPDPKLLLDSTLLMLNYILDHKDVALEILNNLSNMTDAHESFKSVISLMKGVLST